MWRKLTLVALPLVAAAVSGCTGSNEIKPTTEATQNISSQEMSNQMQKSLEHMPPERRAMMEQRMKNMPIMKDTSGGATTTP